MSQPEPDTTQRSDTEPLPKQVRDRLIMHGETAPYHRRLQQQLGVEYTDLHTWADLRETFDHLDDESLRNLDPRDLTPKQYAPDDLIRGHSSGTTGAVKTIYWHEADVKANIDYVETTLRAMAPPVPTNTHWVATSTPNPVLMRMLEGVAARFKSTIDIVEVEPAPIKRALRTGEKAQIQAAFEPIAEQIHAVFEAHDVQVYEDIAPLMRYVGTRLPSTYRTDVRLLLIGGVGTTPDVVSELTTSGFPNAVLTGWYGDYMTGSSMMHDPASLEYFPQSPDIRLEVRNSENITQVVPVGTTGEVVAHAIRRGFFVPNRRIGDLATRVHLGDATGITDVSRIPE